MRKELKDVDGVLNETCVGVDFCNGTEIVPNTGKLAKILAGMCWFASAPCLSSLELGAILGHLSWFALMSRPTFACFHEVYKLLDYSTASRFVLPRGCLAELFHFLLLVPLLTNDLTRPWQECLLATDASDAFGFGVSVAPCSTEVARRVGREGAKRDKFVRLDRTTHYVDDEAERPRKGSALHLPLSKSHFKSVVSSKRLYAAHSGSLEAHGVILGLKWLLRSPGRHGKRTPVLIDALTVLGAAAKGRSSAPSIRHEIREISALILAGNLLFRPVYIPSEDNPADAPSRGIVRRWRSRTIPGLIKSRHGKAQKLPTSYGNLISDIEAGEYRLKHLNRGSHHYF